MEKYKRVSRYIISIIIVYLLLTKIVMFMIIKDINYTKKMLNKINIATAFENKIRNGFPRKKTEIRYKKTKNEKLIEQKKNQKEANKKNRVLIIKKKKDNIKLSQGMNDKVKRKI